MGLGQSPASLHPVELDQPGMRRFVERRQRDELACGLDRGVGISCGGLEVDQPSESSRCQLAEPVALGQHPLLEARLSDLQRLQELAAVETVRLFEGGRSWLRAALSKAATSSSSPSLARSKPSGHVWSISAAVGPSAARTVLSA
jgi:hypothetical protein